MLLSTAGGCIKSLLFFRRFLLFPLLVLTYTVAAGWPQSAHPGPYFARRNTFSFFGAYSNDSSHILLGDAEQRKLLNFGAAYGRRLLLGHIVNWQYSGEFVPLAMESDPQSREVDNQTFPTVATHIYYDQEPVVSCAPQTQPYILYLENGTVYSSGTATITCFGRYWTIGEAFSPVGFQWNFLPQRKVQPFLIGHGGFMYSTKPIPVPYAGSFNFTFDVGAGIEVYRAKMRSIRVECRYHHISNHDTAIENPGIDNGMLQVTYSFGR